MPLLMEVDTGSFDFAGRIAGRDSACFAQDDKFFRVGLLSPRKIEKSVDSGYRDYKQQCLRVSGAIKIA